MAYEIDTLSNLLIEQYKGSSKILVFVEELQRIFQLRLDILCQLERLTNPQEAYGVWLDYIGLRLGILRPSIVNVGQKYFGFDISMGRENNLGFDQGPIQSVNPDLVARIGLADSVFVKFIRARARFVRNDNYSSLNDVKRAFNILFETDEVTKFAVNNYVITILIASFVNPEYYRVVNENLDYLVPRPAGVQISISQTAP